MQMKNADPNIIGIYERLLGTSKKLRHAGVSFKEVADYYKSYSNDHFRAMIRQSDYSFNQLVVRMMVEKICQNPQ